MIYIFYRNPTPSITQQIPLKWKPVRTKALEYLLIPDSQNLKMSKYLLKERMEFWASIPHRDNVIISKKISHTKDEL